MSMRQKCYIGDSIRTLSLWIRADFDAHPLAVLQGKAIK